jgi:membrane-bound ClpP family serine protease
MVIVHGEYWQAISDQPIAKGENIRVVALDHMFYA